MTAKFGCYCCRMIPLIICTRFTLAVPLGAIAVGRGLTPNFSEMQASSNIIVE